MALTEKQANLLLRLGLPTDFQNLSDEQYFAVDDKMSEELQLHGLNEAGDGLNEYGELCRSIIVSLPDN